MIVHSALGAPSAPAPDQKARDLLDRLLRGRQADAQQAIAAQRREALERQREMGAALVRRERVDLVDDHGPRGRQHRAAGFRAEQDVERFRRGDDDVRRRAAHALALAGRRVAGAHPGADLDVGQAAARAAPRGCRRAALPDCAGCRSRAPSAARRRRPASRPASAPASPWRTSASIAARKAASVLPEPVGAAISVWRPAWIAGHASRLRRGRRGEAAVEPGGDRRMKQRRCKLIGQDRGGEKRQIPGGRRHR